MSARTIHYLASPYWHALPIVREARAEAAAKAAHWLIEHGHAVYSPIAHRYFVEKATGRPIADDIWLAHGLAMLRHASTLVVLTLDGWRESKGVAIELDEAECEALDILWMDPATYERRRVPPSVEDICDRWQQ